MLIGKNRAETTLASAALHCAGARIVRSRADLALLIEAKRTAARPRSPSTPLIAIVPPNQKRNALASGVDAAYTRPLGWKPYLRLVQRVLSKHARTVKSR